MVFVMAAVRVRPESVGTVERALAAFAPAARAELGCLQYEVFRREGEPLFVTQETWSDEVAEAAHMTGQNVAKLFAEIAHLLAAPAEIHRYRKLASRP
jgi:quinol monooxygenase YgiN